VRTLSFQELLVFREVARTGGITAAADKLGLAKSAVSKQLNGLEQCLRLKLFARSSRRVSLTREGERLLPRVESLIAEGERLLEDAREEAASPAGVVRIAASPEFGTLIATHFLPRLAEEFTDLDFTLKLGYAFEDLQDPAIDLAFRIGHVDDERLVALPLGEFRRILVASPTFAARRTLRAPTDLAVIDCLVFSARKNSADWVLQHRLRPERIERVKVKGRVAVLSFTTLMGMAEAGSGVGYIAEFVVRRAIEDGTLVHCLSDWASRPAPVFVAYRQGMQRIARVRAVIEAAREALPGLLLSHGVPSGQLF
jgi:DNA-binding transcriptional LysR family regulator